MNGTKTEFSHGYLAEATRTDSDGQAPRGIGIWRKKRTPLYFPLRRSSDITIRGIFGQNSIAIVTKTASHSCCKVAAGVQYQNHYWANFRHATANSCEPSPNTASITIQAIYKLSNKEPLSRKRAWHRKS